MYNFKNGEEVLNYRNSHREFNKMQIKRFRHSIKLCLFCTFFRGRTRLLVA